MSQPKTLEELRQENKEALALYLQTNTEALNYELRLESIDTATKLIHKAGEIAELDVDKLNRRISVALKSEYGKVPGLLNLLSNIVAWPAEQGSAPSNLTEIKQSICEELLVSESIFTDLKESKGFHTFISDDHEVISGVEPDYLEYIMLLRLIANKINIPVLDIKLTEESWDKAEARAIAKAEKDMSALKEELEAHNKLHGNVA